MPLHTQDLGSGLDFQKTWQLQEDLLAQRLAGDIPDTLLLLEHTPVYTIGRTRDQSSLGPHHSTSHLPHPVVEINRGGQATYHGPGQLTGYAIIDLNHYQRDLHQHLRSLEEILIRLLTLHHIQATRKEGLTGVWIGEKKIASLGVGVRKWITLHGFAINITAESLTGFQHITPCGLPDVTMTSLETETGTTPNLPLIKSQIADLAQELFNPPGQ